MLWHISALLPQRTLLPGKLENRFTQAVQRRAPSLCIPWMVWLHFKAVVSDSKPKPNVQMESQTNVSVGVGFSSRATLDEWNTLLKKVKSKACHGLQWQKTQQHAVPRSQVLQAYPQGCSFTDCPGWEAEAEWDASGLGGFDISRQLLTQRAKRLRLWQNAAAEWPWQMEAAADLKGSGKLQTDSVWQPASAAAPYLWEEGCITPRRGQ